jgi:acyl-CoA thioester hydrolase
LGRQPVFPERRELHGEVDAAPEQVGEPVWSRGEHVFQESNGASDGTESGRAGSGEPECTLRRDMSEPFTHVLRVRYGECDPQGVVFNANYFSYFDIALTELWRESVGPYTDMMASGVDMVVAEARARYLAPAGFDDELAIHVLVTRLGSTSMTTSMRITRGPTPVVEGDMRHVFIDAKNKRKIEVPPEIRRGLQRHLAADSGSEPAERESGARPNRSEDRPAWSTSE